MRLDFRAQGGEIQNEKEMKLPGRQRKSLQPNVGGPFLTRPITPEGVRVYMNEPFPASSKPESTAQWAERPLPSQGSWELQGAGERPAIRGALGVATVATEEGETQKWGSSSTTGLS